MTERLLAGPVSPGARSDAASDTIDVADVARTFRRRWHAVAICVGAGILGAIAVLLFAPRRFDGKATVFAPAGGAGGASIAGRMTGVSNVLGSLSGFGAMGTLETELQLLKSRELSGQVVDSLQLQFIVAEPARLPATHFIAASAIRGSFEPRAYDFTRLPNGTYQTGTYVVTPGTAGTIDVGSVTLQRDLPAHFTLKLLDREDAVSRFQKHLTATKAGGDVAKVTYRGDDSLSAAAGANALIAFYLNQRKTTDRALNHKRVEYVTEQLDSTGAALALAEVALRRQQETSNIFDPDIVGKVEWESSAQLRHTLTDLKVQEAAIHQLLAQLDAGEISAAALAAYPAFMGGSAVAPLAQQLSDIEGKRIQLLERRTEADPDVRALDDMKRAVQVNIAAMARSYAQSVTTQRREMQQRVDSVQRDVLALPQAVERGGRLRRDILRLTQIYTALQAQLVEARLSDIGEGGDIRQIDVAVPQRKPAFPRPVLTMGIGAGGGLFVGLIVALFLGWFGRWLRDPVEIERAVGVTAQRLEPDAPLFAFPRVAQSILVVPLAPNAETTAVAERIARTARQRYLNSTVVDLRSGHLPGNGRPTVDAAKVGTVIEDLERQDGIAVVQLPDLLSDTTMSALRENRPVVLVAPPGPVDRARLAYAVDMLRRLQVPCAGVVMSELNGRRAHVLTT